MGKVIRRLNPRRKHLAEGQGHTHLAVRSEEDGRSTALLTNAQAPGGTQEQTPEDPQQRCLFPQAVRMEASPTGS